MPKIDINLNDLEDLAGIKVPRNDEDLEDKLQPALAEVEEIEGNEVELEIKGSNRPDLWSVEGIARQLRFKKKNKKNKKLYDTKEGELKVKASKSIKEKRPYIACAVINNVNLSESVLESLIQTQKKIDGSFGRDRKKTSIGLYDYDLIEGPIEYKSVNPEKYSFTPLEFEEEISLEEILKKHPKGQEYGHIISKYEEYPVLIDSKGDILSLPPVINSNDLGQVTPQTKNILIEVTGTDHKSVNTVLEILSGIFSERGGTIKTTKISYEFGEDEEVPKFGSEQMTIKPEDVRNLLGLEISNKEIIKLLNEYGYEASTQNKKINVEYPSYRVDIMHKHDIIEDIAISFGYDNFEPEEPKIATEGGISTLENFVDDSRETMTNLGFQEVLSFTLTNSKNLAEKMERKGNDIIRLKNPTSENLSVLRNSVLPDILEFLSENKHRSFPQKVFEAGEVFTLKNCGFEIKEALGAALSKRRINYSEMASILEAFVKHFDVDFKLKGKKHKSFINGRCADILAEEQVIGKVGEIHPKVLENWNLEKPVAAFEINLEKLLNLSN